MGRLLILLAPAAMLLAACSSDSDTPEPQSVEREIVFSGQCDDISRTQSPLSTDYGLWVTSLYHCDNPEYSRYYLRNAPLVNKTVGENTIWCGSDPYFYPPGGNMDFFAYAVRNPAHIPSVTYTPGLKSASLDYSAYINKIRLDFTGTRMLDTKEDVLVSAPTEGITCNATDDQVVPLSFQHLLCCVRFYFKAKTEEAEQYMWVTKFIFDQIRMSGIAELSREAAGDPWTIDWPTLTAPTTLTLNTFINPSLLATNRPYLDFYLPAQPTKDVYFSAYYRYRKDVGLYSPENIFCYGQFVGPENWEAGIRYLYEIEMLMLPHIEFRVSFVGTENMVLEDWRYENVTLTDE